MNRWIALALCLALSGCTAALQPSVSLSTTGQAYKNGYRVFPIGIYAGIEARWVDTKPEVVDRLVNDLANSPFDFVINYGSTDGTLEQQKELFKQLSARGVRDLASVKDLYPELALSSNGPFAGRQQDQIVRETVAEHRTSPAVIGWYISDEPEGDPTPILHQHRRVKETDPDRPTLMVSHQSKPEQLKTWVNTADILAVDPYPIPKRPVTTAADVVRTMKQFAGDKPVWFVLQAFGGYQYEDSIRDKPVTPSIEIVQRKRPPTVREMRCLTYSALAEGADGLVFYYHKDLVEGVDADRAWPAAKSLAQEIRELSPVLLSSTKTVETQKSSDEVRLVAKEGDQGFSLIVANTSPATQSVIVTVPPKSQKIITRNGECFHYLKGSQLLLILDGLESLVIDVR